MHPECSKLLHTRHNLKHCIQFSISGLWKNRNLQTPVQDTEAQRHRRENSYESLPSQPSIGSNFNNANNHANDCNETEVKEHDSLLDHGSSVQNIQESLMESNVSNRDSLVSNDQGSIQSSEHNYVEISLHPDTCDKIPELRVPPSGRNVYVYYNVQERQQPLEPALELNPSFEVETAQSWDPQRTMTIGRGSINIPPVQTTTV